MNKLLPLFFLSLTFNSHAEKTSIDDGIYYSYWAYGKINSYKISELIISKPNKIDNSFYFINNTNDESNNEIYMLVKNKNITLFYKHDEIEGGPSIGWDDAKLVGNELTVNAPTVKNFYDDTNGDSDENIRYKIGEKFPGNNRPTKEKEIIPLQKINPNEFKVDCSAYFEVNMQVNNLPKPVDDPMKDYSKKILMNNNGLCNIALDKQPNEQISKGWILFKKIQ